MVTADRARLDPFAKALAADPVFELQWADSGKSAIAAAGAHPPVLAVIDETLGDMSGLDLVRRLLSVNALINTAVLSGLDPETFHETSEGLGVLAHLPLIPGPEQAGDLVARLKRITAMVAGPPA